MIASQARQSLWARTASAHAQRSSERSRRAEEQSTVWGKLSEAEAALAPHMAGERTPPRQPDDATTSLGTQTPLNLRPEAPEGGWIIRTSDEGSSLIIGEAQHDWNRSTGPSLGSKSLQRGKRSRELRRKRARRSKPQARRSEVMRQVCCEVSSGGGGAPLDREGPPLPS